MDTSRHPTGRSPLRTVFRYLALAAFICVASMIVLSLVGVVLSVATPSSDPHGYSMIFGVLCSASLVPVAIGLWLAFRALRPLPRDHRGR
jgi:hypothetical protein